jgi:hypothetical protein
LRGEIRQKRDLLLLGVAAKRFSRLFDLTRGTAFFQQVGRCLSIASNFAQNCESAPQNLRVNRNWP